MASGSRVWGICRVEGEMESAEPANGDDLAVAQRVHHRIERGQLGLDSVEPYPRSASRTGDGLRMEAAVARVGVLRGTIGAHREGRHRRARAVVGHALHDGEPGAAMRAIGEGIAETPLRRA